MEQILSDVDSDRICMDMANELNSLYKRRESSVPVTNFHNLLAEGDLERCLYVLNLLPNSAVKKFALNTRINYFEDSLERKDKDEFRVEMIKRGFLELPLAVASYNGDFRLVENLINRGASVLVTDSEENNIIHCLVKLSMKKSKMIPALHIYASLMSCLSVEDKQTLHKTKNKRGWTPLDLACETYALEMMVAIVETLDVYRFQEQQLATINRVTYKLPKEKCLHTKSQQGILNFISNISDKELNRVDELEIFDREPFLTLIEKRGKGYGHNLIKMLLWQILLAGAFLVQIFTYLNGNTEIALILAYINLGLAFITAICDVLGFKASLKNLVTYYRRWRLRHPPTSMVAVVRLILDVFLFFLILSCIQQIMGDPVKILINTFAQALFYLIVSFSFFLQYFNRTATFIHTCASMIKDTCIFLTLGVIIFLAYTACFFLLHLPLDAHNSSITISSSFITNVNQTQSEEQQLFQRFASNCYEMFLLSLTIAQPVDFYFQESHGPSTLTSLYVACIVVWSIILLNLLIAIYNDRMAHLSQHERIIRKLYHLSMVLYVESYVQANWFLYKPFIGCQTNKVTEDELDEVCHLHVLEDLNSENGVKD